ncbi:putative sugar O-methyltransferase [Solirubrobacter soli]|uniref:putative sugar O-methyltransferase n=1 Tax=Solirubrobacter soli TaxID=363832 RepID=UPI0003FB2479|nr:putative sugar O-methyltransferase [Solirubrobacter soli]
MPQQPSQFWSQLQDEHKQDLESYGLEHVKRHQALRYFTFQWTLRTAWRDPQFLFLARHLGPRTLGACAREGVDVSDAAWEGIPWSKQDRWLYAYIVRLLAEYARRNDPLGAMRLDEPLIGDPPPVRHRGRVLSQDLSNSVLEVNAMARAFGSDAPSSILEIGAGYGRVAYVLLSLFPDATYTIVDIEPAQTIQRWYLSHFFAPERLRFLSPDQIDEIVPGSIDLGVAISSLHEMTKEQVADYLQLFDRAAAGGNVYLKQFENWTNPVDGIVQRFDDYPVPTRWQLSFRDVAPVQTTFIEAAWKVPA